MKILSCVLGLGIVLCLLAACGKSEQSPLIVCELDGKIVPTVFTFAQFKRTLAAEHGQVEATGFEQLQTSSLLVSFKQLANGNLLAERAVLLKDGQLMAPAVLFGLTNAVRPSFQAAPPDGWTPTGTLVGPITN